MIIASRILGLWLRSTSWLAKHYGCPARWLMPIFIPPSSWVHCVRQAASRLHRAACNDRPTHVAVPTRCFCRHGLAASFCSQAQGYEFIRLIELVIQALRYLINLTLCGLIKTAEQRTVIQQYGDWYTGRWWVGCYIWYSEEGPERAAAPPSPLLVVPNVTASVPTSYYSMWHYNCLCT